MKFTHSHFCQRCYGWKPSGVTTDRAKGRGWYRCSEKHCTKQQIALCRIHTAAADAREGR